MNNFDKMIEIICLIIYIFGFIAMMITLAILQALLDIGCIYYVVGAVIMATPAVIVFGIINPLYNTWYNNGNEDNK